MAERKDRKQGVSEARGRVVQGNDDQRFRFSTFGQPQCEAHGTIFYNVGLASY